MNIQQQCLAAALSAASGMRTHLAAIAAVLCAGTLLTACSSDDEPATDTGCHKVAITLTMSTQGTRAALDEANATADKTPVTWTRGDEAAVYLDGQATLAGTLTLTSGEGQSSGTFQGEITVPDGSTPSKMQVLVNGATSAGSTYDLTTQTASLDGVRPYIVAWGEGAYSETPVIEVAPVTSILRLNFDLPDGVTDITGATVTGAYAHGTVAPTTGQWTITGGASDPITVTGLTIEGGKIRGYVAVLPGSPLKDLHVTVTASNGIGTASLLTEDHSSATSAATLPQGALITMGGALDFVPSFGQTQAGSLTNWTIQ